MAKKKKRPDLHDEDFNFEDQGEPAGEEATLDDEAPGDTALVDDDAVVEEIAADEAVAEEEAAAALADDQAVEEVVEDVDADAVVEEADEDKDGDEDKEGDQEEEEEKPRARVTLLTMILCVFNILAACGFAFLLMMDFQKRQQWEYASMLQDLHMWVWRGKEREETPTADRVLPPPVVLSAAQLAAEFKKRNTGGKVDAKEWQDLSEVLKVSLKPSA